MCASMIECADASDATSLPCGFRWGVVSVEPIAQPRSVARSSVAPNRSGGKEIGNVGALPERRTSRRVRRSVGGLAITARLSGPRGG